MKNYDIPLHDIKPIIEVQEYSLYYLIASLGVGAFLFFGALFLLYKWYQKRNLFNIRVEHKKLLDVIDFKETKKAAYAFTLYGLTFRDDSPRHIEMYKNLTQRLDEYKYKKDVEAFDDEVLGYIELYKEMIDV